MSKKNQLDEYQLHVRNKISHETLLFTFLIILVNGVIKSFYLYAHPFIEGMITIYIALSYFFVRKQFFGVDFTEQHAKQPLRAQLNLSLLSLFAGIMSSYIFLPDAFSGKLQLIEDGVIGFDILFIYNTVYFLIVGIIGLIRYLVNDKRRQFIEEQ